MAVFVLFTAAGHAAAETPKPAQLRIMAGGQAYQGPPVMTVRVDETAIAEIVVRNAIDSLTVEKPSAELIGGYLQAYDVDLPALDKMQRLRIEFTNDLWAGPEKPGDRNLWIGSVTVAGRQFDAAQLVIDAGSGRVSGNYVLINQSGGVEIGRPPEGWQAAVAAKAPVCTTRTELVLTGYALNQLGPSTEDVSRLRTFLRQMPELSGCRIAITGSTSPGGGTQANKRVAMKRADAIAAILRGNGISADRISIAEPATGRRAVIIVAAP
ncbi:MAG: carbohydrate-binding domain-containing protein [Hyphomicrobiales bacterium]